MDVKDVSLIYLTLQLTLLSYLLLRAEKRVSYFEGRQSIQQEIDEIVNKEVGQPYYSGKFKR